MENEGTKENIMEPVKYLAELAKEGTLDLQSRPINKSDKIILKRIAKALPNTSTANELERVVGYKLKENGMTTIDSKDIVDDKIYTVYAKKQIKVNQYKKLVESWKVYESPLGVVFYGCSMFPNKETHNQWCEIINDCFGTTYPPLYPDDYFDKKEEDVS